MSLVDDIMIKYVFKNEVSMLSSLFIDYKKMKIIIMKMYQNILKSLRKCI